LKIAQEWVDISDYNMILTIILAELCPAERPFPE
jgi:hypothetical protein